MRCSTTFVWQLAEQKLSQSLNGGGKVRDTLGSRPMSLRPGCEGQNAVHSSSTGNDLASIIRATIAVVCLGWYVLVPTPTLAQAVYGSIFGTVTDQSGAAVVGARLTVTATQKGTKFETTTNESGNYTVTHLIPGQYDVRSEAVGFKVAVSSRIPVYADQAARVDVQL